MSRITSNLQAEMPMISNDELATRIETLANDLRQAPMPEAVNHKTWYQLANLALSVVLESQDRLLEAQERLIHLERLAVTDELTGLANRRGFEERFRHEMAVAQRHGVGGVVIFIDLDGFKPINDTFGHQAGDEVLRQVSGVLHGCVRETDLLGRIGGDEFVVLMPHSPHRVGLARAKDLDRVINNSFAHWDGHMIALRASCGVQTYVPADDWRQVMKSADHAMYQKKNGTDKKSNAKSRTVDTMGSRAPRSSVSLVASL